MAKQYKCVVFDVDGTLLDSSEGLKSSIRYTVDKCGLPPLSNEQLQSCIGPRIQDSFQRLYGLAPAQAEEMAAVFRDRYKGDDLLLSSPYEGIYEVFDALNAAGIRTAIATYKREDYALRLLKHFQFDKYTDIMHGSDFAGKMKKKDIIAQVLREAGITDHSQAVMVGDSDNDAQGASDAGAAFVGATYGFGFRNKDDVFRFDAIGAADRPAEIAEIILGECL